VSALSPSSPAAAAEDALAISRRAKRWQLTRAWPPVLGILLLIGVWELVVKALALPNFVLPLPQEILAATIGDLPGLGQNALTTVYEASVGFIAGSAIGFLLAAAMVMCRPIERILLPLYVTINSVPMIAFGPLVTIWFGIGVLSKIVLIMVVVSYTVLLNALAGLRSCDPGAIALLRSFGAGQGRIMVSLRLPGALPSIFSGLKVAVVHSMILAVVVEMLGARSGLGWSIFQSTQMMNFVDAWAAVLASVSISLVIYGLVSWANKRAIWWPQ
jgi:NitT/TauT family transport system permease protein